MKEMPSNLIYDEYKCIQFEFSCLIHAKSYSSFKLYKLCGCFIYVL